MASVFTIAPGLAFLDTLAAGLLARYGDDPLDLERVRVLLPTRRACRALDDAFLRARGGRALIAPAARAIGDLEEDEFAAVSSTSSGGEAGAVADQDLALPPAVPPLRRQLLLAGLILDMDRRRARGPAATGPPMDEARAAHLAAELGRLLDQIQIERLSFEGLAALVPDDFAAHWRISLDFLRILTEHWPRHLAAHGLMDVVERRNLLLASLVREWRESPPSDPVIAAGSTGSAPATADLIAAVAELPNGAVILPALDTHLDAEAWAAIDPVHPQYGLKVLLERLGVAREAVRPWPPSGAAEPDRSMRARAGMISAALRPARATAPWRTEPPRRALDGLGWIDCPGPTEEAGAIALRMREVIEAPRRTAALITPDRALARRVAVELARWGIAIDDSAGTPLDRTPPGTFLRATLALLDEAAAPLPFLAALKHPLAAGGLAPGAFKALVRRIELAILRGPRPPPGLSGLRAALGARRGDERMADDTRWLVTLEAAAAPFAAALASPRATIATLLAAHVRLAEFLATSAEHPGAARLWAGEAGEVAAAFVHELGEAGGAVPRLRGAAYRGLFDELMAPRVVRPRYGRHPRLHIWGPLEARLQHADLLILGGLNAGCWPADPPADPWMSRPMRAAMGLGAPERRIGLSAHDFFSAACAPNVVLTRAEKVDGTPTVPSRWLLRIATLLGPDGSAEIRRSGRRVLAWQARLDPDEVAQPCEAPTPRPPLAARPRRLRATEVETWMRDPYGIYARRILGLAALPALDEDAGAAERGIFVHAALDAFVRRWPDDMPGDALEQLLRIGGEVLGRRRAQPAIAAFWWPCFERIARAFVANEAERRPAASRVLSECRGEITLDGPGGPFALSAKADRIEAHADGGVTIVDYKTGATPQRNLVEAGLAPQLPIEAVIARAGGFETLPPSRIEALAYWRLSGREPAAEFGDLGVEAEELRREAAAGLSALIAAFDDPDTPYLAVPRLDHAPRFNDYEHLARTREWSAVGDEEDM